MGVFAPGHADHKAGKQAMHNALSRTVERWTLRAADRPESEIGIVLDIWQRHPATDAPADRDIAERDEDDSFRFFLDPLLRGSYGDRIIARLEQNGLMPDIRDGDLDLIHRIDFLGLNVYSRVVVSAEHYNPQWWVAGDAHPGGNFLDNGMEFYPRSVYDAIFMARTTTASTSRSTSRRTV